VGDRSVPQSDALTFGVCDPMQIEAAGGTKKSVLCLCAIRLRGGGPYFERREVRALRLPVQQSEVNNSSARCCLRQQMQRIGSAPVRIIRRDRVELEGEGDSAGKKAGVSWLDHHPGPKES